MTLSSFNLMRIEPTPSTIIQIDFVPGKSPSPPVIPARPPPRWNHQGGGLCIQAVWGL